MRIAERFGIQFHCPHWQFLRQLLRRAGRGRQVILGCLSLIVAIGLSMGASYSRSTTPLIAQTDPPIQLPLLARGSDIIDQQGRPVLLRGVNWFGMETETQAPHGLWARDYKEMLTEIRQLGYNIIRLPYSVKALRGTSISGVDFSIGSNRDFEGKTPLEVMDLVVEAAARQGLFILLDSHRLNNERIPELWYGDGFTEEDWINTWLLLAQRYRNHPNVIGADLKNEPHGRASWGTGDRATDWRLAAERAGNAILRVNPDWLIVVEGVEKNVPGQRLSGHWWGGNLEGVRRFPVRLTNRRKLVYSPHEYGPGVANQAWFSDPTFPRNLRDRWEIGFHYIATQRIAPIFVGEFGGRQVDTTSKEGIWQRKFIDFLGQNQLGFAYWSWNPNSRDTGGILLDDWKTIDAPKQALLNQLLPAPGFSPPPSTPTPRPRPTPTPNFTPVPSPSTIPNPTAAPSPSPSPTSSPSPSPTPGPTPTSSSSPSLSPTPTPQPRSSQRLRVESQLQSEWHTGFCISFVVTNPGTTPVTNWKLQFQMNQAEIYNHWNGVFSRQGKQYTITPPDWGRNLPSGRRVDLGFCANKRGADFLPTAIAAEVL